MSLKPKCIFSGTKNTVLDHRVSLMSETLELSVCLKSSFRLGISTVEDLYAIVSNFKEEGMEALDYRDGCSKLGLKGRRCWTDCLNSFI